MDQHQYHEYRENLLNAIERRSGVSATYLQTQPIKVSMDGVVQWKGKVEVFQLKDHPAAKQAFGWGFLNAQKKMEYIVVVGVPPLDSPLQAVKAFIASRK